MIIKHIYFKLLWSSTLYFIMIMPSYALFMESLIPTIESTTNFVSTKMINNTNRLNLYKINLYKIDHPNKNEKAINQDDGEILYTPLKKMLSPNEFDYFKIIYNGPKDDKERYYHVVISENDTRGANILTQSKKSIFFPTINLNTYLVVRPRKINFKYLYDKKSGYLENVGNTFFRVLLHKNCDTNDDSEPNEFNLLPKEKSNHQFLKKKSRKFLVFNSRYINISNCD